MFQTLVPKDSKVRALPYPFSGAISISSDVEYLEFGFFETFMNFVNTKNITPFGQGLGLELTSSMFFYSVDKRTFSYFDGESHDAPPGQHAERINEYLLSGWIDTNHSYGDFYLSDQFTRNHALRCLEVLKRLGVYLPVFTNHGGNRGNFGNQSDLYSGDIPGHSCYNSDLLKDYNTKYVWLDSGSFMIERSGLSGLPKYLLKKLLGFDNNQYLRWSSRLLKPVRLRDKNEFKGFVRFRSTGRYAPDISSLGSQLNQIPWRSFYKNKGVSIIYQHLGVMSQNNSKCVSTNVEDILSRKEVFLSPFYLLEQESKLGKLWVCGTARLLLYADVVESARINYDASANRHIVDLDLDLPIAPQKLLEGLTFYINPEMPVELYYKKTKIDVVHNGPDETGQYSVSVPIRPLKDIWKEKKY